MYPIPPHETLVETKVCKHCQTHFPITDKDMEFYEKVSPVFHGKKYTIPSPTLCPDCRQQRRLSWRNESKLYKRKCDATGKDIISIYSPDKPYTIYHQDYWWSDKWDPMEYGRDFDFSRGFFEQFHVLQAEVPRIALLNGFQQNAEYANHSYHNKNSYLVNGCSYLEDCLYATNTMFSNNCLDVDNAEFCNVAYEIVDSKKCNFSYHLFNCLECYNCYFCEDCIDCKNCIGCKGLQHKEYYMFNTEITKEEYDNMSNGILFGSKRKNIEIQFDKIKNSFPSKGIGNLHSDETFASDKCNNSKGIKGCFECDNSENLAYCCWMLGGGAQDCYDFDQWGEKSSLVYETHCTGGGTSNILFCNIVWGGHHTTYCDLFLSTVSNCFGCVGLHSNEEYCILNKQYTKEEYEALVPRIIEHMMKTGEWGEFFPASMSPFGYNETVANEYFPLTKSEATKDGIFNWSDYEPPFPQVAKIIPASKLPDSIESIPDDILNWAIECEVTKKPFRIIKQELEFYRKHSLPIPRRHPDQRHLDRMKMRNPRKLFERKCDKCKKEMITTYSPDRKEIVYCEECYNREVVG